VTETFHVKPIVHCLNRSCPSAVDADKAAAICACQLVSTGPAKTWVFSSAGVAWWLESLGTIFNGVDEVFLFSDIRGVPRSVHCEHTTMGPHNGLIEQNMGKCNFFPS